MLLQNNNNTFQLGSGKSFADISGTFGIPGQCTGCVRVGRDGSVSVGEDCSLSFQKRPELIGGNFWLSSIAMLVFLQDHKERLRGRSILELGAGVALPSRYLHHVGCDVTASDRDVCHTIAKAKAIDWEALDARDDAHYDVLLAADCIYKHTWPAFLDAVQKYKHDKIVVVNAERQGVDETGYALMEMFGAGLTVRTVRMTHDAGHFIDLVVMSNVL